MYKTGDLLKNVEKLKLELKQIKYPERIEFENLQDGNPLMFLPILHFTLLSYSKFVAQFLLDNDYELFSKSDKEFINKIFKAMIDLFNFKPTLNPRQFFLMGYTEAKVIFCLEVIRIVKNEHNSLMKKVYSVNVMKQNNRSTSKNKSKSNESFRKENSNEYLDRGNNLKKVKVVNHSKENKKIDLSPKFERNYETEINYHNEILTSPKFNDDEDIVELNKNKYKFNNDFVKYNTLQPSLKENIQSFEENNQDHFAGDRENYVIDDDTLFHSEDELKKNNNFKENRENFIIEKEEEEEIRSNGYRNPPIQNNKNIPISSKSDNNLNNNQSGFDFTQLVEIINNLAYSVKDMTNRMDKFKTNIEDKVTKMEAEIYLLKNKVNILESNQANHSTPHKTINNNESSNLNENNDYIFSFADDNIHNSLHNISHKLEDKNDEKIKSNLKNDTMKNKISNYNLSHNNINQNPNNNENIYSQSQMNNNYTNKIPSKIMNDIEDTDSIIERVANRFKETQKLLNEFK